MIRPLRTRHRWMTLAVGAVTGILLIAALAVRRDVPPVESLRVERRGELTFARPGVDGEFAVYDDRSVSVSVELEHAATSELLGVYWVPESTTLPEELPEQSFWLGRLDSSGRRSFRLPEASPGAGGQVVLYSLARYEILDRAVLSGDFLR